jgi:hypothetical protein
MVGAIFKQLETIYCQQKYELIRRFLRKHRFCEEAYRGSNTHGQILTEI